MKTPPRVLVAILVLPFLCVACRTSSASSSVAIAEPRSVSASSVSVSAAPGVVVDRASIIDTAQSGDGSVWGVGSEGGMGVFRWRGERWEKVADASGWPGGVVELMADPARPAEVVSLWVSAPTVGGDASLLHLWRHAPDTPARLLASFPNPTADPARESEKLGRTPRLALDSGGNVWITFPAARVVHLAADGGEPRIIEIPADYFTPVPDGPKISILPLAFEPGDAAGEGWLWTTHGESSRRNAAELFRPLSVVDGRIEPAPELTGLPDATRVTLVRRVAPRTMAWAFERVGLWRVDFATRAATPMDGPPGAWRILDWREWSDGLAVALVFKRRNGPDQLDGDVWVRRDGVWRNAGPSGDTDARVPITGGGGLRPRDWLRPDGALLGGRFHAGPVWVDLAGEVSDVRNLDWRAGLRAKEMKRAYPLPDGRVLFTGSITAAHPPGALRRGVERGAPTDAWSFVERPVRAPDGRLWCLRSRGRGAPALRHWDGAAWHEWALPAEPAWWAEDAWWVDERGRVAVFASTTAQPAWERDPASPDGWRRWATGEELLEARAAEDSSPAGFAPVEEGFQRRPVFGEGGRALIGEKGGLAYFSQGAWRRFTSGELGEAPYRYGFGEDGVPWFFTNQRLRRLDADGTWRDVEGGEDLRREQARARRSHRENPPDWLRAHVDLDRASAAHADGEGVWWIVHEGELWKGRDGEAVRMFAPGEASPFRVDAGLSFHAVEADARGNRLFVANPLVLLAARPGPELRVEWQRTESETDRVARVTGEGLERFEWRLDGGEWRRGESGNLVLHELPAGAHTLELRGYNRRLDAGPVWRAEPTLTYDASARVAQLVRALGDPARRADAVRRLAMRGAEGEVREALASEEDETLRWWLRAALQAIEDEQRRRKSL